MKSRRPSGAARSSNARTRPTLTRACRGVHAARRSGEMSDKDLVESVSVLRDEVLDTVEHGDREPPGTEVFDAVLRALAIGGESVPGLDLTLHDSISRRLAWGDSEEVVLADAESVFDRLLVAVERAFRDADDQMVVIEAATLVAVTVARVVAHAAVTRA